MLYNIHYEVCSLLFLTVLLVHFLVKRNIRSFNNRFFMIFIACGMLDLILDIASSVMISFHYMFREWQLQLVVGGLFVFQLVIPYMLYLYVLNLCNRLKAQYKKSVLLNTIPFFLMAFLVLTNVHSGLLFYFGDENVYVHGSLYYSVYIYGIYYVFLALANTFLYRKQMKKKDIVVVWEFTIIGAMAIAVQMFYNYLVVTGVGIALGITVLMLTINNPHDVTDSLTGLLGMSGLRAMLSENRQKKRKYQLIAVALDGLSRINYAFGVEQGDQVLVEVSKSITEVLNREQVFRFVGDRFIAVTYDERSYEKVLDSLKSFLGAAVEINGIEVGISACVCGFKHVEEYGDESEIIAFVDYSISKAKKMGAGTLLETDEQIMADFRRYRELEEFLYTEEKRDCLEVYYQPIYSVHEKRFVTVEALARLTHPQLGPISPAEFIAVAEHCGQIAEIGKIQFEKICSFFADNEHVLKSIEHVKVNLSPAELMNEHLSNELLSIMKRYDLSPSIFQFEITETIATMYKQSLYSAIDGLKRAGCGLCLDDFGSGYANLDAVMKLPFDVVKIDSSMLYGTDENEDAAVLYQNVFHIMSELGFTVVAEGAETKSQVDKLVNWGVDLIQGYYLSKPVCEDELVQIIGKQFELITSVVDTEDDLLFDISALDLKVKSEVLDTDLFEFYRFVDLDTMQVCSSTCGEMTSSKCYEIWGRTSPCDNCISKRLKGDVTKLVKFEHLGSKVLLVLSVKYPTDGRDMALELVCDVTKSFETGEAFAHGTFSQVMGTIRKLNRLAGNRDEVLDSVE